MRHSLVPPTANLITPDPACDIHLAQQPHRCQIDVAVSNSLGFGGQNAVLVFLAA